jgi:hypothetical protein
MQGIGGLLVLLGAGSFVFNMLGREFTLISWIDNWGPTAGIGIRVAMIVVGAGLWFMGRNQGGSDAGDME